MKSKIVPVILIVLVIIAAAFAIAVVAGGVGGNKVTVKGNVSYNIITGWGVTYDDCIVKEDGILTLLWYMPWETKDIEVVVELSDGKTYSASEWVDKLNLIIGSTSFSIDVRHVSEGDYTGTIYVYEVEKGFLFGEKSRVLQASTSFEVDII